MKDIYCFLLEFCLICFCYFPLLLLKDNYCYIYSISKFIEYPLAFWGGKLCVAIYAFIGGYGNVYSIND